MTVPRTVGRKPFQRTRPALPTDTFSWSRLPTWPMVAMQSSATYRTSPEGSLRRSEEHTSELQSRLHLVCRLLLEKKKKAEMYVRETLYNLDEQLMTD